MKLTVKAGGFLNDPRNFNPQQTLSYNGNEELYAKVTGIENLETKIQKFKERKCKTSSRKRKF